MVTTLMPASSMRTRSGTAPRPGALARRRVADAVGLEREQRVGVVGRGDAHRVDPRQRARVDAVLLLAVHPHADELEVGPAGDRRGSPAVPTPPVDHPTTRYVIGAPFSSQVRGLGREAQADVGDRRALDLVGARRSTSGAAARPARRRTTRAAAAEPSGAVEHGVRPERARADARCAAAARSPSTLLIAPSTSGRVRLRPAARAPARRAGSREPAGHEIGERRRGARGRRYRAVRRGVPGGCASPSPATPCPTRSPSSAPVSCRQPSSTLAEHRVAIQAGARRSGWCRVSSGWRWRARGHLDPGVRRSRGTSTGRGGRVDAGSVRAMVLHQSALVHAGGEHLLAVEHEPAVAVVDRGRRDVREVASRRPPRCTRCSRSPCPRSRPARHSARCARTRTRPRSAPRSPRRCRSAARRGTRPRSSTTACQLGGRPPPPSSRGGSPRAGPRRPPGAGRHVRTPRPSRSGRWGRGGSDDRGGARRRGTRAPRRGTRPGPARGGGPGARARVGAVSARAGGRARVGR